jgi:hypothetical protein
MKMEECNALKQPGKDTTFLITKLFHRHLLSGKMLMGRFCIFATCRLTACGVEAWPECIILST